jgi:hypothetical protein
MLLGSRARPMRKAIAICGPIVYTMWDPQHLNPISLHGLLRG